jgi:hypothetical protein
VWRLAVLAIAACGSREPAPSVPSNRGAPPPNATADHDDDGVADMRDRCPDKAEDWDAFADEDGCPEPDNDHDGVLDETDDCPYEPGPHKGCLKPCRVFVTDNHDCFLDPSVFYDANEVPQQGRIDAIVKLVRANPFVRGLEVMGERPTIVARPLRVALPGIEITETVRDLGRPSVAYVTISKQRLGAGRFRELDCTPFGAIYRPARVGNCTR